MQQRVTKLIVTSQFIIISGKIGQTNDIDIWLWFFGEYLFTEIYT